MKIMTKTKVWILAILIVPFFMVSCNTEEDPPAEVNEAELLVEWMESPTSPAADYGNGGLAIKSAEAVHTLDEADQVTIIDIRSAADFADGHIDGAVNKTPAEVRDYIDGLASYNEISIVCYTGQTAGWLTSLLQLAGYKDVYAMKFGMSSWHADFDKWSGNTATIRDFVADVSPKGDETELPSLSTGFETAEEIFDARWDVVLAEGFGAAAISNSDVYDNLSNYYIINYWPNAEYLDPGHIQGAIQYTPSEDLKLNAFLKTLPTDKTIVVYCYTGQNSARVAAYLRMIGYDAKSLKFGANGMIYDDMTKSQWSAGAIMGYDHTGM